MLIKNISRHRLPAFESRLVSEFCRYIYMEYVLLKFQILQFFFWRFYDKIHGSCDNPLQVYTFQLLRFSKNRNLFTENGVSSYWKYLLVLNTYIIIGVHCVRYCLYSAIDMSGFFGDFSVLQVIDMLNIRYPGCDTSDWWSMVLMTEWG